VHQEKELLEKSLAIKENHFGKGHVQSAATLVNLAGVFSELGDTSRGRELLRHSLAIEEQHFGAGHVETAITLNNLALACGETGDVSGMRQLLERSLKIKDRHFGPDHLESCLTLANLGMACGVMGDENLARDYSSRALLACGGQGNPKSRRRGVVLLRAAAVHCALAEVSAAEVFGAQALSMLGEVLGPIAGARVLGLERTRTSRIWSAAGRDDVVSWLDITWATEKLETKDMDGETSAEERESVISTRASEVLEESALSAEGEEGDVTPRRSSLGVQTIPPSSPVQMRNSTAPCLELSTVQSL